MSEEIELQPDPERVIVGLRDTGYEFNTAVADLVDNSIAAHATRISVQLAMDFRGAITLIIADNGQGMDRQALIDAMRYGSKTRPNPASLGKYGLGLKTASTAFCRRLSVISRPSGDAQPLMATWDLNHVAAVGKWALLLSEECDDEGLARLDEVALGASGTAVLWQQVDRLIKDFDNPGGAHAQRALKKKEEALREHLGMVYQRFLDHTDSRGVNVKIDVNGTSVVAWDPFQTAVSSLVAQDDALEVNLGGGRRASFSVRAYILPRREEFPDEATWRAAKLSNERQGIYIYRENRLIHDGDWLGIYTLEPHFTYLRVEFSFDHRLDDAFHLDIKKSQIILNEEIADWLEKDFLPAPRREANRLAREGTRREVSRRAAGAHDPSNNRIRAREGDVGQSAQISAVDAVAGTAQIQNPRGTSRIRLAITSARRPGEVFIQPVDSIDDGLLFQPALIQQHKAVQINTAHPYYHKVYVPNLNRSVTLQGLDSLLWALSVAELSTVQDSTAEIFRDMRYEVSRILSKLVESIEDPLLLPRGDE